MAESFDRILAAARRRVSLNVLLAQCALVLAAAAVPAAVVVVVQRAIAVQLIFIWTIWAFVVLVGVCAGVLWYRRRPGRMRTALLVDERLALRERFSTALAVAGMDAPFALAAIEDARRVARSANLEGYFPVGLSSRWLHAVGGWFIVLMLALLLPELDVFGRAGEKRGRQEKAERLSKALGEVRQVNSAVTSRLKNIDDPEVSAALAALNAPVAVLKPAEVRREAIGKLTSLAESVRQMRKGQDAQAAVSLNKMLKDLRVGRQGPEMSKLKNALARGDFAKAAGVVGQLQDELAKGNYDPKQKAELSEQLEQMGSQLKALAAGQEAMEEVLAAAGLDKSLVNLNDEQLRRALAEQNLTPEQMQELVEKLSALRLAFKQCNGLGEAMLAAGACLGGQLSPSDLDRLGGQLSELEIMQMRMELAEATLEDIADAMACLGANSCQGSGLGQGTGLGAIPGMGLGRGPGIGPRPTADDGLVGFQGTRVKSNTDPAYPPIATWAFAGEQVRGEARQQLREAALAARDGFAEAVSSEKVPKKYEGPVKAYFSRLAESGQD